MLLSRLPVVALLKTRGQYPIEVVHARLVFEQSIEQVYLHVGKRERKDAPTLLGMCGKKRVSSSNTCAGQQNTGCMRVILDTSDLRVCACAKVLLFFGIYTHNYI